MQAGLILLRDSLKSTWIPVRLRLYNLLWKHFSEKVGVFTFFFLIKIKMCRGLTSVGNAGSENICFKLNTIYLLALTEEIVLFNWAILL